MASEFRYSGNVLSWDTVFIWGRVLSFLIGKLVAFLINLYPFGIVV